MRLPAFRHSFTVRVIHGKTFSMKYSLMDQTLRYDNKLIIQFRLWGFFQTAQVSSSFWQWNIFKFDLMLSFSTCSPTEGKCGGSQEDFCKCKKCLSIIKKLKHEQFSTSKSSPIIRHLMLSFSTCSPTEGKSGGSQEDFCRCKKCLSIIKKLNPERFSTTKTSPIITPQ